MAEKQTEVVEKSRSGFWHSLSSYGPFSAILVTIFIFLASQILAVFVFGMVVEILGGDSTEALTNIQNVALSQFFYTLLVEVFLLYMLWLYMKNKDVSLSKIGLGRLPKTSDISPALLIFAGYFLTITVAFSVINSFEFIDTDQEQQIGFENVVGGPELLIVFVSLVILPSIVEEILIRGFLYSGLRTKFTKVISAIVASVVFGIAHLQLGSGEPPLWIVAIDTAVLSMFLIYLREKTGALWSGMLVHAMKNSLAFYALFVLESVLK